MYHKDDCVRCRLIMSSKSLTTALCMAYHKLLRDDGQIDLSLQAQVSVK